MKAALVWRYVRESGTFAPYLVFTIEEAWPRFKRAALCARVAAGAGRVRAFSWRSSIERWGYAVPWRELCNCKLNLEPGTVLFFRGTRELRRWFTERVRELLKTEEGRRNAVRRLKEYSSSLLLMVKRSGRYADEFQLIWLRKGLSSEVFLEEVLKLGEGELEAVHEALEWMVELASEGGREDIASYTASLLTALRLIL
jgi:hypothetical protein